MLGYCVYRGRGWVLPSGIKYPSSLLRQLPLQRNAAVMPGQPGRIQRVVHVAKPTSVSSKSSVGIRESYELSAIHSNGTLQSQQRLLPKNFAHVNRNKRLTLIRVPALMGFYLRSSKPLTPTLRLYLPECLAFHSKLPRFLKICAAQ